MTKKVPVKVKNSKNSFLIESLKFLVDGIAETFGSRCEVVLHDLEVLDRSIVKIANGHVTGRTIGGPITDEGLKFLKSGRQENLLINYSSVTKNGKPLKSSTFIFRNNKGKPTAAICINIDMTDLMNFDKMIKDMFKISEEKKEKSMETFEGDIVSTLNGIADKTINKAGKTILSMDKRDKIEIIRELEDQGFFLIKGAIKLIASKLRVSKFTVYNYLEQIRGKKEEG